MFFSSKTVEAMFIDHIKIRKDTTILKNIIQPISMRRISFKHVVPLINNHADRQETVIYKYMLDSKNDSLVPLAFEAFEEHKIVLRLIEELYNDDQTNNEWSAKGKLLGEVIDRHLDEEENDIFPMLENYITSSEDHILCENYLHHIPKNNSRNFNIGLTSESKIKRNLNEQNQDYVR